MVSTPSRGRALSFGDVKGPKPTTVADVLETGGRGALPAQRRRRWRHAQNSRGAGRIRFHRSVRRPIVALNGGFDFFLNNFNRATQARRQPGVVQAVRLFSGIRNGFTPATVLPDAPPDVGYQPSPRASVAAREFRRQVFGPSRLREALYLS